MPIERYLLRRDTSADWADANPILAQGEPGVETDTRRFKVGDGVSVWTALPYAADAVGAAAVAQAAAIAAAATDATSKASAAQAAAQSYADGTFVPAAGLDTATAAVVTPGGSATAAAIAADPALRAAYVAPLSAVPLWVYGHSYTITPGVGCTSGAEFFNLLKAHMGFFSATTYGVGSSRMVEVASDVINQAPAAPVVGSTWTPSRSGIVVLDCEFNDAVNPDPTTGNFTALSATQVTNYQSALTAALAVLSSASRVEAESGTLSGTTGTAAGAIYSGSTCLQLKAQNAYVDLAVTVPASGDLWVLMWIISSFAGAGSGVGAYTIAVDGVTKITQGALSGANSPFARIKSNRGTGDTMDVGPMAHHLTGLTPGAHTVRITKTDAGAGVVFPDAVLVPSAAPPKVAVLKDPLPATSGSNSSTISANRTIFSANRALLHPAIDAAVANFANAVAIDAGLDYTQTDLRISEGAHPNDKGMRKIEKALAAQVATWLATAPDALLYPSL